MRSKEKASYLLVSQNQTDKNADDIKTSYRYFVLTEYRRSNAQRCHGIRVFSWNKRHLSYITNLMRTGPSNDMLYGIVNISSENSLGFNLNVAKETQGTNTTYPDRFQSRESIPSDHTWSAFSFGWCRAENGNEESSKQNGYTGHETYVKIHLRLRI